MTMEKVLHLLTVLGNRKAEWERKPWMSHIKQVLHMVLTRAGLQSCVNSETPPSSPFPGSPNTFIKEASLWGTVSLLPAQLQTGMTKGFQTTFKGNSLWISLLAVLVASRGSSIFFHSTKPHELHILLSLPPLLCSWSGLLKPGRNEPSSYSEGRLKDSIKALPFLPKSKYSSKSYDQFSLFNSLKGDGKNKCKPINISICNYVQRACHRLITALALGGFNTNQHRRPLKLALCCLAWLRRKEELKTPQYHLHYIGLETASRS